jgi:cell division protein FtsX
MRLLLVIAGVAVLAGCGGSHAQPSTTSAQQNPFHLGPVYAVNLYFCNTVSMPSCSANATGREEHLVGSHLRREQCVKRVVFTSKAQALAEMKKKQPKFFKAIELPSNPLPDSFKVLLDKPSCAPAVATAARAAHWPGVQAVKLARRPATRAGS